jgi:Predicted metal-dependent phosphoesterases (PHP family)
MGRFRLDAHAKILDERVVERAKARGLDGIVYAPHFTRLADIRTRAERFSDEDLLVIPGREVFTGDWRNRKHVLAVGLSEPVPDFITLEGALAEFERQGAAVLAPHPEFATVSLESHDIRAHRDRIHALEAYNPKYLKTHTERSVELAAEFGLPSFGSSYAHLRGTVGEVWTEFDRSIGAAAAVVDALREGASRSVRRRDGLEHRLRCGAEFTHLCYENSWGKIDRLFLSGTEPTHPDHIAYGGRFADVSVY